LSKNSSTDVCPLLHMDMYVRTHACECVCVCVFADCIDTKMIPLE